MCRDENRILEAEQPDQKRNEKCHKAKGTRNFTKRKTNPKIFWKYVQSKTQTKERIGDLFKDEERTQMTNSGMEKSDVLSEYFSNTFA